MIECNAVYSFSNLYSLGSGEKPYPCRFCGRRFRTNYNKLGHEKKCPDRHNVHTGAAILAPSPGRLEEIARKRRQRRARWDLAVAIIATSLVHQRNHEFQFTVGKTDHNDQDYDDH